MKNQKITTYQMAVTAVMAAVLCVLGPLTVPIGAIPISLANFVICLTAWLLGPKFGTLSVVIYLAIGLIGVPVFSGYGAGLAKVAGPTGGYLVGYLLLAFIGGLFIEKAMASRWSPPWGWCWAMPPATSWVPPGSCSRCSATWAMHWLCACIPSSCWIWPRSWCPALWVPCCASVWCRPVCCI